MAVQAQYPSNVHLPDFRKRARPSAVNDNRSFSPPGSGNAALGSVEDSPLQPVAANLLRLYNSASGFNVSPQPVPNIATINETDTELAGNLTLSRKRLREIEDLLARQHSPFLPLSDYQQNNTNPFMIAPSTTPITTGLRLTFEDVRIPPASASTTGRGSSGSSLSTVLNDEFQTQYMKQREEVDELIRNQAERLKQALEEKRQRHTRELFVVIEDSISRRLNEKDLELEKVSRRNLDLEERVKQLSLESQLWQNLAKNNEAMVTSLKSNLEQVVAQSREQSKEGCGESEVDDAESCNFEDSGDAHARTVKENRDLKEQRTCRVCRNNSVCILLLPCRHLCLCKDCDARRPECPLCGIQKNASVQVFMD